jgi:hypothetical protein
MRRAELLRQPLLRLLAINLAAGVAVAALLLGGLLYVNPGHLRELIFADSSPALAFALLLFGFVVTFGSVAMGTAIMAMGTEPRGAGGRRAPAEFLPGTKPIPVRVEAGLSRRSRRHSLH